MCRCHRRTRADLPRCVPGMVSRGCHSTYSASIQSEIRRTKYECECKFSAIGVAAGKSMGAVGSGRHLHGLRRQLAVRMDAVRQSHRCQVPLGPQRHSGGFHHLRADRDLAGSRRRLPGRSIRAEMGGARRRHSGRHRMDAEFDRQLTPDPVFCRRDRRCRDRLRLRHLRRQCAQMVPGPSRSRRRHHGFGLRRRRRTDHRAHPAHDQFLRLRAGIPVLRAAAGRNRVRRVMDAAGAARDNSSPRRSSPTRRRTDIRPPKCCAARCSTCCI